MLLQATYFSTINPQFVGLLTHILHPPSYPTHNPPGEKPEVTWGLPIYGDHLDFFKFSKILGKNIRGTLMIFFDFSKITLVPLLFSRLGAKIFLRNACF